MPTRPKRWASSSSRACSRRCTLSACCGADLDAVLPPAGLLFVTGNPSKLVEARRLTASSGRVLEAVALDLPEIQSLDMDEVLRAKAWQAWKSVQRPVVVEETGLELAAMNGFPGPLVKWMLEAVGAEGIARAACALGEARAEAVCLLMWTDGERFVVGRGVTTGDLVLPPRGGRGFGWDPVFRPAGETRTYGELVNEEKDRIGHRGKAWRELLTRLERGPFEPLPARRNTFIEEVETR